MSLSSSSRSDLASLSHPRSSVDSASSSLKVLGLPFFVDIKIAETVSVSLCRCCVREPRVCRFAWSAFRSDGGTREIVALEPRTARFLFFKPSLYAIGGSRGMLRGTCGARSCSALNSRRPDRVASTILSGSQLGKENPSSVDLDR